MPSFSRGLEKALHQAMNLARERSHEFATLEHLLLALTEDRDTISVLTGCDVDIESLRADLEEFIGFFKAAGLLLEYQTAENPKDRLADMLGAKWYV